MSQPDEPTPGRPATEAERKVARALIALARHQLEAEAQAADDSPEDIEDDDVPGPDTANEDR